MTKILIIIVITITVLAFLGMKSIISIILYVMIFFALIITFFLLRKKWMESRRKSNFYDDITGIECEDVFIKESDKKITFTVRSKEFNN